MLFALIVCIMTVVIWFDYLSSFKSNDIYMISKLHSNGTITSQINQAMISGTDVDGMYEFAKLNVR